MLFLELICVLAIVAGVVACVRSLSTAAAPTKAFGTTAICARFVAPTGHVHYVLAADDLTTYPLQGHEAAATKIMNEYERMDKSELFDF